MHAVGGYAGYTSLSECVQAALALLIAANSLMTISFSTTGWATYSKVGVETGGYGLWRIWTCKSVPNLGTKCTHGFGDIADLKPWYTAFQTMMTIGLISYVSSLLILFMYGCNNRCKGNKKAICTVITTALFGGVAVLCGIITFAVKMWSSLSGIGFYSYSFFFAIISVLAILIGMIPLKYERKALQSTDQSGDLPDGVTHR